MDNPGDIDAAVKQRCPLYDELAPIMADRPNAKPLDDEDVSDTGSIEVVENDNASNAAGDDASGVADTACIQSMKNGTDKEKDCLL